MSLVLASESPRRRQLLTLLGVPFTAEGAAVDERTAPSPALAKASAVHRAGDVTLAADTEIDLDGERLGKPGNADEARAMLARLGGRTHEVVTEIAVLGAAGATLRFSVRSRVRMRALEPAEIAAYVATGEPLDKAGAYGIQGEGRRLVGSYEGCLANVVGLPLCHVAGALHRVGVSSRERAGAECERAFAFSCPVRARSEAQARRLQGVGELRSFVG